MTGESFEADYLVASRPVLVQGAANQMEAKRKWSRAAFFERVGHHVFAAQKLPMWKAGLLKKRADGQDPEDVTLHEPVL
jgi:hypothetical protein